MNRYNFEEHITAYIDGELSEQDKNEFKKLIESDSDCKTKYEEIKNLVKNLKSIPKLKTNDDFMMNLNNKIDSYDRENISIFSKIKEYIFIANGRSALGFAMSFGIIFVVSYLYLNNNNSISANSKILDKTNSEDIYYSDSDSTDSDEYKYNEEIHLTKGNK